MTNTLKIPEKNMVYYRLFRFMVEICIWMIMALIGYVCAIVDIGRNLDFQYPDMTRNIEDSIIGVNGPQYNMMLAIIGTIIASAFIMAIIFWYLSSEGLTPGINQRSIALHEEEIEHARKRNLKNKGRFLSQAKRVDEIEQLMTDKDKVVEQPPAPMAKA